MRFPIFLRAFNYNLLRSSHAGGQSDPEVNSSSPECEQLIQSTNEPVLAPEDSESSTMASSENNNLSERGELQVELPPPKPDMYAPPPYEEVDGNVSHSGLADDHFDPSTALQPPSYEEVQRLKALEAGENPLHVTDPVGNGMQVVRISSFGGIDPQTAEIAEEQLLGTDFMFFVAFTAAFLFNLVGIVLLLCLCHTVAGRTGALAGFGLSLAKWVVIFRHSTDLVADSNSWLLWLIMILGLLICVRAILQYISAKRDWQQLPHNSRHRFFLFY